MALHLYDLLPRAERLGNDALLSRLLEYTEARHLTLYPAQETAILELFEDKNVILNTPTGSGKSTLFRAMAGLWRAGRGRVLLPAEGKMMFLPQKAYLPVGNLRSVVSYPAEVGAFDDAAIKAALADVDLARWADHLDDDRYWAQQLSPGEQQRLAFARVLLHKPDWLFADEASAALDEAGEAALYRLIEERLPGMAIVSIGHRGTLGQFHERRVELQREEGGVAKLVEVPAG
jgi:putative ATP-binding cassette transporter